MKFKEGIREWKILKPSLELRLAQADQRISSLLAEKASAAELASEKLRRAELENGIKNIEKQSAIDAEKYYAQLAEQKAGLNAVDGRVAKNAQDVYLAGKRAEAAEAAARVAAAEVKETKTAVSVVKNALTEVKGSIAGLGNTVNELKGTVKTAITTAIESNSVAKKAVGLADDALKGLGGLLTKVAPLLDIAGTLFNIATGAYFGYEIYKLWKELGAQKALIEAAKIAGLTAAAFALSKATAAALIAGQSLTASTVATARATEAVAETNLLKNGQQALATEVAAVKNMNTQQFQTLDTKLVGIGQSINNSTNVVNNHTTQEIKNINIVNTANNGKDYTLDLQQIKSTQAQHSGALANITRQGDTNILQGQTSIAQGQTIINQTNEKTLGRIIGASIAPLYAYIYGSFQALYNWLQIWVVNPLGAIGAGVLRAEAAANGAKAAAQSAEVQATLVKTKLGDPFSTPGSLIAPSIGTVVHPNFASLFSWIIYQMDALLGQWPIKLEIEDSDLIKTGDQTLSLEFPNLSEAVAEMIGLAINTKSVTEANLDASMRALMETGSGRKQGIVNHALLEAIQDYLGFSSRQKMVDIPFTYSPIQAVNSNSISQALQPSTQKVKIEENTDGDTLEKQLKALMEAARIIKAVHTRKLNPNNVEQWKEMMKASRDQLKKTDPDQELDDFDLFLQQVEEGFTSETGTDPTKPYDRNYSERPRTRRLNQPETPNV